MTNMLLVTAAATLIGGLMHPETGVSGATILFAAAATLYAMCQLERRIDATATADEHRDRNLIRAVALSTAALGAATLACDYRTAPEGVAYAMAAVLVMGLTTRAALWMAELSGGDTRRLERWIEQTAERIRKN